MLRLSGLNVSELTVFQRVSPFPDCGLDSARVQVVASHAVPDAGYQGRLAVRHQDSLYPQMLGTEHGEEAGTRTQLDDSLPAHEGLALRGRQKSPEMQSCLPRAEPRRPRRQD